MNTFNNQKNPLIFEDWHREDIIAAVHKKGWSLRQLSLFHGYSCGSTLKNALDRPWLKGERLIADVIGVSPEIIWSARYKHRSSKKRHNSNNRK